MSPRAHTHTSLQLLLCRFEAIVLEQIIDTVDSPKESLLRQRRRSCGRTEWFQEPVNPLKELSLRYY